MGGLLEHAKWPEGDIRRLVEERRRGLSFGQIALRLGRSRNACISKWHRIGMAHETVPVARAHWTDELDRRLLELLDQRRTYGEIARVMDRSPSQCRRRAHALGRKVRRANNAVDKSAIMATRLNRFGSVTGHRQTDPGMEPPPATDLIVYTPAVVTIEQLQPHHCRWPLGDPKSDNFRFCGADKVPGRSYCQGHDERGRQPLSRTGRPFVLPPYDPAKRAEVKTKVRSST